MAQSGIHECFIGKQFQIECRGETTALTVQQLKIIESRKGISVPLERYVVCLSCSKDYLQPDQRGSNCVWTERHKGTAKGQLIGVEFFNTHLRGSIYDFKVGQRLCTNCIVKIRNGLGKRKYEETDCSDESGDDEFSDGITPFNEYLRKSGIEEIIPGKLNKSRISSVAYGKLRDWFLEALVVAEKCGMKLANPFALVEDSSHKNAKSDLDNILSGLKGRFGNVGQREKIQMLTLAPKSWTIQSTMTEFNTTKYMVKKSRELGKTVGILALPPKRIGRFISADTVNAVRDFFYDDEISRCLPGMNDCIKVNGQLLQKRLLLHNVRDVFEKFKLSSPIGAGSIGVAKFCALRPKEVYLSTSNGMHNVCVCTIHSNVKFQVDELGGEKGLYKELMALLVCNVDNIQCVLEHCTLCKRNIRIPILKTKIRDLLEEKGIQGPISFSQWESTDRSNIRKVHRTLTDFVEALAEDLCVLVRHHFISKRQSEYCKSLRESMAPGTALVQLDFAENYSFLVQNASQGFHWRNEQATVHPFVAYVKALDNSLQCKSYCIISDEKEHVTETVFAFITKFLEVFKVDFPFVNHLEYFSDGCGGQYKNFKNFVLLTFHEVDFGLTASWNFFATSHGKGPCDGVGGTLKRMARKASLQLEYILYPKDLFDFLEKSNTSTRVLWLSKTEVASIIQSTGIASRFINAKTVKGTRGFHRVEVVDNAHVRMMKTSNSLVGSIVSKLNGIIEPVASPPLTLAFDFGDLDIGDTVAVAYECICYLGVIGRIDADHDELFIRFLKSGIGKHCLEYTFEGKGQECYVTKENYISKVTLASGATRRTKGVFKASEECIEAVNQACLRFIELGGILNASANGNFI